MIQFLDKEAAPVMRILIFVLVTNMFLITNYTFAQKEIKQKKFFIPKFYPLHYYTSPDLRRTQGTLPEIGTSFKILEEKKNAYKITYQNNVKHEAYVLKSSGYVSGSDMRINFGKYMNIKSRVPLRFWENESKVEDTGGQYLTDFEETLDVDKFLDIRLPILEVKDVVFNNQKVRLVKVVLRFPRNALIEKFKTGSIQLSSSVLFLVDWSGSMLPEGKRVLLSVLEQMANSQITWHKNKKYSAIFYRDGKAGDLVEFTDFTSFSNINSAIKKYSVSFQGGIEEEEPFLDALYFSLQKIDNLKHKSRNKNVKNKNVIVAFISVDVREKTNKSNSFKAPAGLRFDDIAKIISKKNIKLIVVQVSPEPGKVLTELFRKKHKSVVMIPYQLNLSKIVEGIMKEETNLEKKQEVAQKNAVKNFAKETMAVGGFPIYPIGNKFQKLESIVSNHLGQVKKMNRIKWIQIPLWTIQNDNLFQIVSEP